jgi:hypothetical protein
LLEVIGGAVALIAILVGVSIWRLSAGPISVDFLTPHLEQAFSETEAGLEVDVGRTELIWDASAGRLELRARYWRVRDGKGRQIAVLPSVGVLLSMRALLQGVIAPTLIEIEGARVRLVRNADGSFDFAQPASPEDTAAPAADGATQEIKEESDLSELANVLLRDLLSEPDFDNPLTFMQRLRISNTRLRIVDRRLGIVWRAPRAEIDLARDAGGLNGQAGLVLALGEERANVEATLIYDAVDNLVDLAFFFADLRPAALAGLAPELEHLGGVDLPLDGSVSLSLDLAGDLRSFAFDLAGSEGRLEVQEFLEAPLEVASFATRGSIDSTAERLELDYVKIAFGTAEAPGPGLSAALTVESRPYGFEVAAEARVADMPADDLRFYWPTIVDPSGRAWVIANIRDGMAREASLSAAFSLLHDEAEGGIQFHHFTGGYRYEGLTVDYLAPMEPATDVDGTARYDLTGMFFDLESGRLRDVALHQGKVDINGFDQPGQMNIAISFEAGGPLRTMLEVLDHPRIKLISKLGIQPEGSEGTASTEVAFRFPLKASLQFDDVEVDVKAHIDEAKLIGPVLGQDVTQGVFDLNVDETMMHLSGPLELGGIPMTVEWTERFDGQAPATEMTANVPLLDDAARRTLGIDLAPYLSGPVSAKLDMSSTGPGAAAIGLDANLDAAEMTAPMIAWHKPPGRRGSLVTRLELVEGRLVAARELELSADNLSIRGAIEFDPDTKALSGAELEHLVIGKSALQGVSVTTREDGGWSVSVAAGEVDAEPFVSPEAPEDKDQPAPERQPAAERSHIPILFKAEKLDRVYLGGDRYVENARLELDRSPRGWERLNVVAEVPKIFWHKSGELFEADLAIPRKTFRLVYGPALTGGYALEASAEDMGATLRALNINDAAEGGKMRVIGSLPGPLPDAPMTASLIASDFILKDAPVLAKLLTVASLTGLLNLMTGEGITFNEMIGDFRLEDDVLSSELIRVYGSALGLTAQGYVHVGGGDSDLAGTVVPAYSVNQVLGEIPLLGFLLTGGEGEGVFAITYRVTGDISDPSVSVNPLSVLAPGFLRGLFGVPEDEGEEREPLTALPGEAHGK